MPSSARMSRYSDEVVPGGGRVFADILEDIGAAPGDALGADRGDDAVEFAIHRAQINKRLAVIGGDKLIRENRIIAAGQRV